MKFGNKIFAIKLPYNQEADLHKYISKLTNSHKIKLQIQIIG